MKFLIKEANVVLKDCIKKTDILIENGIISKIEDSLPEKTDQKIIRANGLFCMPGLVDIHVHLREPGFEQKETIKTASKAAAKGGITSIACMANTNPVTDSKENLSSLIEKIKKEKIKIYPVAAITKSLKGKEITNFEELAKFGVCAFSDDGFFVENANIMKTAMQTANKLGLPIFSHCEDKNLAKDGVLNEGVISQKLNLKGIPDISESLAVLRDIALSYFLNCPIHICHVSSKKTVEILKMAKKLGVKITAETAPHYFMLTEDELLKKDANFKMNPPLKTKEDTLSIEDALLDGTIDCIATDHAPHEETVKTDLKTAANGVIGLETSLSCVLTHFYETKKMDFLKITDIMCKKPAQILKIKNGGEIFKGAIADIILVDPNRSFVVKKEDFLSKSSNSPFIGKTLKGKVVLTFSSGELIYKL